MIQTGMRVSELTALTNGDVTLTTGAHVHCHGKGRKERITPLSAQTAAVLGVWQHERVGNPEDPLFATSRGRRLGRDAVAWLLAKHLATATPGCPSLRAKTITPHTLRHAAAMRLLHAGVDITVIALWLGHESTQSTQTYLHADLALKEKALARTAPTNTPPGRVAVVAVVVAEPAAGAVLAGLGRVGAQDADHEPDAASRDPGDAFADLRRASCRGRRPEARGRTMPTA
jgi:integrase/recombinase XerD